MTCPDDDALAALLDDTTSSDERATLLAHLDACEACRVLVADAAAAEDSPAPQTADRLDSGAERAGRGDPIGRYVVDRVLGTGATGIVYAAHDPQLARDVALKVLRPGVADREALLREARTVARLSHPNVVAIHDADAAGDRLFIAMELVDGTTLSAWLAARPRTWPEIRDVMLEAGRGLAAAHAAGIVHRDVKPDNILVARDGRTRVTDFGLARLPARPGLLAGTPAYMAPEQRTGKPIDARADLYSFCVVLHEALFDARPEPGAAIPTRRDLPARARRALERGLARDPADRPASMDELLAALAPRRRPAIAIAAAAALVTAAIVIAATTARRRGPEPCTGGATAWADVWSPAERDAIRAAFTATGLPSAAPAFERADTGMRAYQTSWIATHRDVCLASERGEQSTELLDRRMRCLDTRRKEAVSLAHVLAAADRGVADRAGELVRRLVPAADCTADAVAELAPRPPGTEVRRALDTLEARAADAHAQQEAGLSAACLATISAALPDAQRIAYQPLLARLLYTRALCEPADAQIVDDLHAAAAAAATGHDDATLAGAWIRLVYIEGFVHHRIADSERWQRYARAILDRLGSPTRLELAYLTNVSLALLVQQRMDEARALTERRRAILIATEGAGTPALAEIEETLGNTYLDEWRFAEAEQHYLLAEAVLARHAPSIGARLWLRQNESVALRGLGRAQDAVALFPQIFAMLAERDPTGDDSWARCMYADALRDAGDPARALEEHRRAQQTCERFSGTHAWPCAQTWEGQGRDLVALGRGAEAVAPLEHALELYGPDGAQPDSPFALALALEHTDPARARKLAEQAQGALAKLVSDRHADRHRLDEIEAWLREHPAQ